MAASSQFQPSKWTTPLEPETTPPRGVIWPISTPLVRTVGVISLSVLNAITDRTFGRNVPTSYWSWVARTAPISWSPKVVLVTMKPGYRCCPVASKMSSYFWRFTWKLRPT